MAFPSLNISKLSVNTANFRSCLRCLAEKEKRAKFSTSQMMASEKAAPIKYSTNKAANVPISEVIGLQSEKNTRLWKENDIDEMLKGNPEFEKPKLKLLKLRTQLQYCEINKLPTAALKAKIEELEEAENKFKYPFRK